MNSDDTSGRARLLEDGSPTVAGLGGGRMEEEESVDGAVPGGDGTDTGVSVDKRKSTRVSIPRLNDLQLFRLTRELGVKESNVKRTLMSGHGPVMNGCACALASLKNARPLGMVENGIQSFARPHVVDVLACDVAPLALEPSADNAVAGHNGSSDLPFDQLHP